MTNAILTHLFEKFIPMHFENGCSHDSLHAFLFNQEHNHAKRFTSKYLRADQIGMEWA